MTLRGLSGYSTTGPSKCIQRSQFSLRDTCAWPGSAYILWAGMSSKWFHHHHHHHQSLNREGRWGTTYDFATSFLHFSLFSAALWDFPNSRPVHSLMLSSHLFLCPPCLLSLFTVPDEVGAGVLLHGCPQSCMPNPDGGLLEVYKDILEVLLVLEIFHTEDS